MALAQQLEVFHGRSSPAVTHVYFRLPVESARRGVIRGKMTGPYCGFARTLPTTVPVRRIGGDGPLWEAVFPDLCFWSTETPHWYRVSITQTMLDGSNESTECVWSARHLATVGGQLFWNEHPTVLRIIEAQAEWLRDLNLWRDVDAAMLIVTPEDALCRAASEQGVALCAQVPASPRDGAAREAWLHEIARLSRWPAVIMLVLDAPADITDELLHRAPNTLLVTRCDAAGAAAGQAGHALLVTEEAFAAERTAWEDCGRTLFVMRSAAEASLAESRYTSDALLDTLGAVRNLGGVGLW